MALYFNNELPYLSASFNVLEAECIICTIWLCPHDQGVWNVMSENRNGTGNLLLNTLLTLVDVTGTNYAL